MGVRVGSGWAGFWVALAILIAIGGYYSRVDCALGVQKACAQLAAVYEPKPEVKKP